MANRAISRNNERRAVSYARQRQEHDAAATRHAAEREREAAQRQVADALQRLEARWGTRTDALKKLGQVSQALDRLRLEQDAALIERDELITQLREVGQSWNSLAALTGFTRQALSKRVPSTNSSQDH